MELILLRVVYGTLLAALLCLCLVGWRFTFKQLRDRSLPAWRLTLQSLGLAGATFSFFSYLAMVIQALLISAGFATAVEVIPLYKRIHPLVITVVSIPLGVFGKKSPRIAVIVVGAIMAILWLYLYY